MGSITADGLINDLMSKYKELENISNNNINYNFGLYTGIPVIINDNINMNYKYRKFKWKLKLYQRILHGFKKYIILEAKYPEPFCYYIGKTDFNREQFIMNSEGFRIIKNKYQL